MVKGKIAVVQRARNLFRQIQIPPEARRELTFHRFFNGRTLKLLTMADRNFLKAAFSELAGKKCTIIEFERRLLGNTYMMALSGREKEELKACNMASLKMSL